MTRAAPLALALGLAVIGLLAYGVALSLDDPIPTPRPIAQATITPTRTPLAPTRTATWTPQPTLQPTWTPNPACSFYTRDGAVCIVPSPTQTLPLPECPDAAPTQACINVKPTLAAAWLMTGTPTPNAFATTWAGRTGE
jgi:hypothetical protein